MSITRETHELIDRYLRGNLSNLEKIAFEKQMREDPMLSEELEMQKMLNELLLEKGLVDIRNKVGEDISGTAPSSITKNILLFGGLLLIATGIMYFYLGRSREEKVLVRSTKEVQEKRIDVEIIHPESKNSTQAVNDESKRKDKPSPSQHEKQIVLKKDLPEESKNKSIQHKEEHGIEEDKRSEEEPINQEEPILIANNHTQALPCPEISFDIHSEASCLNKQTGSIQIVLSSIQGGEKPYSYSIAGKDFGLSSISNQLANGNYSVEIKDTKGCISKRKVHVSEKTCRENKDYSFNPETETWKFPFSENESGTLTISDKSGRLVYKTKIINGSPGEWNGTSTNGEMLKTDTYVYIAEVGNGEIRQGYITILH